MQIKSLVIDSASSILQVDTDQASIEVVDNGNKQTVVLRPATNYRLQGKTARSGRIAVYDIEPQE